ARPVGAGERAVRWCRRNPAVASLAAALVLMFVGGCTFFFWQWNDLNRERDKVREKDGLAEGYLARSRVLVDRLSRLANDLSDRPGLDQTGRTLLQEALVFRKEVMQEKGGDPEARLEAARAFNRVG